MATWAIAGVTTTALAGYLVGARVRSPAEVAARTAPPVPSAILVPVEERVLSTKVVTRGTGRFGSPQRISSTTSGLKTGPGLVASLPAAGAPLADGAVFATASGRPIFLMVGARPMARDLGPGMKGDDVHQLEEALMRLGHDPGPVDGLYDDSTANAVAALYTTNGYAPFTATVEQLTTVRTREAELLTASIERSTAEDAVASTSAAISGARVAVAAAANRAETTDRNVARVRSEAAAALVVADAEVATRTEARDRLKQGTPAAPQPPTAAEIAVAERELAVAVANRDVVRLVGERNIDDALTAAADAAGDSNAKRAALDAATHGAAAATRTASSRAEAVERVTQDVATARARAGVQVPADEIVFVATAPVRVSELLVGIGDPATGKILTVTDTTVHVDGALAIEDANLVKVGMTVDITEPDLGITASGTVATVASGPGTNGVDGFHVSFQVDVAQPPPNLVGASVRLTIPVASSGQAVLAVPASALTLGIDGTPRVARDVGGVSPEMVPVTPGVSADGYVAISPAARSTATLKAGDLVVVGATGPTNVSGLPDASTTSTTSVTSTSSPAKAK
jgi:peptidoglycan hydrolase-like protein with peptidoglycan-binding domain